MNAAALIVTHQHPSGVTSPSSSDVSHTKRLEDALATVDVRVLDHLVIGKGEPFSFAASGLLQPIPGRADRRGLISDSVF